MRLAANGPIASIDEIESEEDFCPIRFQGQWDDRETGLYYNRHRHYDPLVGAYSTPDPIGIWGGVRPYGYFTRPTGWVDPLGLEGFEPVHLTSGYVYRSGSGTLDNLTPRPQDVSTGLSTNITPGDGNTTRLDISKLNDNFTFVQVGPNHVAVFSKNGSTALLYFP